MPPRAKAAVDYASKFTMPISVLLGALCLVWWSDHSVVQETKSQVKVLIDQQGRSINDLRYLIDRLDSIVTNYDAREGALAAKLGGVELSIRLLEAKVNAHLQ